MTLLTLKAVHIIGFVAWFAGLFYLARLFVYHAEALDKTSPEREVLTFQFAIMEKRLFQIIMTPAMILTLGGGIGMLIINPEYLSMGWLHIKLLLVFLLVGYHHLCIPMRKKLEAGTKPMSSMRFRLFNEVPTLFLVAIVLLAVMRDNISMGRLFLIVIALILFLGLTTMLYKRLRQKKSG